MIHGSSSCFDAANVQFGEAAVQQPLGILTVSIGWRSRIPILPVLPRAPPDEHGQLPIPAETGQRRSVDDGGVENAGGRHQRQSQAN